MYPAAEKSMESDISGGKKVLVRKDRAGENTGGTKRKKRRKVERKRKRKRKRKKKRKKKKLLLEAEKGRPRITEGSERLFLLRVFYY